MRDVVGYAGESPMVDGPRRDSITERLRYQKKSLEEKLAMVTSALTALEKNPELQNLFDVVSRVA